MFPVQRSTFTLFFKPIIAGWSALWWSPKNPHQIIIIFYLPWYCCLLAFLLLLVMLLILSVAHDFAVSYRQRLWIGSELPLTAVAQRSGGCVCSASWLSFSKPSRRTKKQKWGPDSCCIAAEGGVKVQTLPPPVTFLVNWDSDSGSDLIDSELDCVTSSLTNYYLSSGERGGKNRRLGQTFATLEVQMCQLPSGWNWHQRRGKTKYKLHSTSLWCQRKLEGQLC